MLKQEFENLIGFKIDDKCYKRIEEVYLSDLIWDKQHIANIYKKYDMNGIEKIYRSIHGWSDIEELKNVVRIIESTKK